MTPGTDHNDSWDDEWNEAEVERPTICPSCGVSMLPPEPFSEAMCENASCDAFGEPA